MEYTATARTDVGRKRSGNEDSFCVAQDLGLFVVADGMGGHAAGEMASRLAVETIREWMRKYLRDESTTLIKQPLTGGSDQANWLLSSIHLANRKIFDAARGRTEYAGMGTTLVAVLAMGDRVALAHVGDSRIYRVRNDQIVQLSKDHSFIQQQLERGILSAGEAHDSQYRHLITRALGLKESVEVDLAAHDLLAGDLLLLCSDGLSDLLEDEEMLAAVREHGDDLEKICQVLIDRANSKGGDDNITVLLIQAREGQRAGRRRLSWLRRMFGGREAKGAKAGSR
jgi:serine/threonine protein phosphatase PrpC